MPERNFFLQEVFPNFPCRFSFLSYWSLQILTFAGNLHFWGWNGIFDDGSSQCNARRTIPYLPECVSPQFFSSSGTYFRSQIFPVPHPVLMFGTLFFRYQFFFSKNGKFPIPPKTTENSWDRNVTLWYLPYHSTPYHAMPYHTLPMLVHAIIQFCNPGLWHTLRVNP